MESESYTVYLRTITFGMFKVCGRCKARFECRADDIRQCACKQVTLEDDTFRFLAATRYDCLCTDCLKELDELIQLASLLDFPQSADQMIEGLHYYREGPYTVFTELYHLLRGSCCQSGCRHCAYGYPG